MVPQQTEEKSNRLDKGYNSSNDVSKTADRKEFNSPYKTSALRNKM